MTPNEKEIMELSIENAMLKGFTKFAETMEKKTSESIASHAKNCPVRTTRFIDTIKDWRTIAATILAIIWLLTSVASSIGGNKQLEEKVDKIMQQLISPQAKVENKIMKSLN